MKTLDGAQDSDDLGSLSATLNQAIDRNAFATNGQDLTFWLERDNGTPITDAIVSPLGTVGFTGQPYELEPTVMMLDGTLLQKDVDYQLSYRDNVNPGTAKVFITGIGNYYGTTSVEFKIVGSLDDVQISLAGEPFTYTGSAIEPAVTAIEINGYRLLEGKDFSVAYSNNLAAGTATVTLTGAGGYSGSTLNHTFEIKKAPLEIEAQNASKVLGEEDPNFGWDQTGLADVDSIASITLACDNEGGAQASTR